MMSIVRLPVGWHKPCNMVCVLWFCGKEAALFVGRVMMGRWVLSCGGLAESWGLG